MSDATTTAGRSKVSRDTDIAVRTFLAQRGMEKGHLSKFIEEAVRWRVFDQTLTEVRSKFSDVPTEELEALIDDAVAAVRKEHGARAE